MGERTRSRIGTTEGVKTVRVYSANPKTADGYNTFIFRRDVARSLNKLAWAPVIDARQNRIPVGIELSDERVRYSREQKKALVLFLAEQLRNQYGPVDNDDFGRFGLQRLFVKEVQRHALATRREYVSTLSARSVASGMVHFAAAPNEEIVRRNGIRYFEYGLAKVRMDDGLYLIMGEVGVRSGSSPYYDQHVVAKFKADSEVSSLQGHIRIGESAFERVYDNRFRLILQGVAMYYDTHSSNQTISNQTIKQSPLFSIIIPVYNVAPYLRECLDSVCVAAEKASAEIICVDDGSTDGSGAILDEYRERLNVQTSKHLNFRVLHQRNAGVSAARNAALDVATGEWVLFVDADDVISPQTLDVCRNAIERFGNVDLVWFRHVVFPQDGRPVGLADGASVVTVTRVDMTRHIDGGIADSAMPFVAVSYRRNLLGGIRFEVGRCYGEDRIFFADLLQRCNRIAVADAACYGYRQRADSAVHMPPTGRILREELSCWIACCERLLADHRAVDASCIRRWALVLTETFARKYYQLPSVERRGLLDFWRREMERLDGLLSRFPFWARSVMRLLRRVPVSPLFWLLCFFPDFLKRKGLHR